MEECREKLRKHSAQFTSLANSIEYMQRGWIALSESSEIPASMEPIVALGVEHARIAGVHLLHIAELQTKVTQQIAECDLAIEGARRRILASTSEFNAVVDRFETKAVVSGMQKPEADLMYAWHHAPLRVEPDKAKGSISIKHDLY